MNLRAIADLKTPRGWLRAGLLCALGVALCYQFVDRPVARFVHDNLRHGGPHHLADLGRLGDPLLPAACLIMVIAALRRLTARKLLRGETIAFQVTTAFVLATMLKDELKLLFGRTWPETWIEDNPSFIRDGVYGFNIGHGGNGFTSFPSGHMAGACAVLAVLAIALPAYRRVWTSLAVLSGLILIGTNAHFVGDVVGGACLGAATGYACIKLWPKLDQS